MKKFCLALCLLTIFVIVPLAHAQEEPDEGRDPVFEQEIYERLQAIDPDAVPVFQEATRAMDAGDAEAAKRGFEKVLELAPNFADALRRLSYVERQLGNTQAAVELARQALANSDSPHNHSALALALLATEEQDNAAEALTHAWAAVEALPDDESANAALLLAGAINKDLAAVRQASETLVRVLPEYPLGHFYVGVLAADDGQWEKAERELLLAQKLGMPSEYIQELLDDDIADQARWSRWRRRGIYAGVAWFVCMPLLFVSGVLLSKLTLATTHRPQPSAVYRVGRAERLTRTLYRVVIAITSLYFYVSIPVLLLIVVAGTIGIFYLFLVVGRIPVRLAVLILGAALYTLAAVVRSVFARGKDPEPGRPLPREQAPQLWALAEQVAERVDARPIDAIYVTPAPNIGVMERGGIWRKLLGSGQRCLILGLGALPGLSQGQFKAILAHEYGHFSNRDTAGGNLAGQVRVSMHHMAYNLAVSGQAAWYNPVWLFVNGFYRIFLRITLGASRLQEILADRYAAAAYGVQNFVESLTHIVRQTILFEAQVGHEVELAAQTRRKLSNLYALPPFESASVQDKLQAQVEQVLNRPTSPYDSHPAIRERIALLQQLDVSEQVDEAPGLAWDLLPDAETWQNEMTAIVQTNVRRRQ